MEKEGNGEVHALIIPPILERNSDTLFRTFDAEFKKKFTFHSIKPVPRRDNGMVDHQQLLNKCREIIKQENVTVLYSNKPLGNLAQSILCKEFPHLLCGPSIESVFLCNHKYYTTTLIDSRLHKLPFFGYNLKGDIYDSSFKLLQKFRMSGIIRSCLGSGHSVYCYNSRDQLIKVLARSKRDVEHILELQRWILENYIDLDRYPLALEPVILINAYVDRFLAIEGQTWLNISIEACVFQGEIIRWAICDAVTLPYGSKKATHFFSGWEMPTKLAPKQQDFLWTEFRKDIKKLMGYGFDNSFINAEYMYFENDTIHLVTINPRPHVKCTSMYARALQQGNNIKASIELSMGIRPKQPVLNDCYVLSYSMVVFESGRADNLVNFEKALANQNVSLRYLPGQDIVIEPAKDYAIIGFITIKGKNFNECVEKVKKVKQEIIKLQELVPLTC